MDVSSVDQLRAMGQQKGRSYVKLSLEQEGQPYGSCVIELFKDMVPATVSHFIKGCTDGFEGGRFRCGVHHRWNREYLLSFELSDRVENISSEAGP